MRAKSIPKPILRASYHRAAKTVKKPLRKAVTGRNLPQRQRGADIFARVSARMTAAPLLNNCFTGKMIEGRRTSWYRPVLNEAKTN